MTLSFLNRNLDVKYMCWRDLTYCQGTKDDETALFLQKVGGMFLRVVNKFVSEVTILS